MGLKRILIQALDGNEKAVNELCLHFKKIALAYIRSKSRRMHMLMQFVYDRVDDLAIDCIADLFGSDERCLVQISEFFSGTDIKDMSESELNSMVRRLVFSKVNEGVYRNYKAFDPSLSRIIRNLKRTLEEDKVDHMVYDSISGEIKLTQNSPRQKKLLPDIPDELLEIRLSRYLNRISNSVDAVQALKELLKAEVNYSDKINLISFAISMRKMFAHQLSIEEEKETKRARVQHYSDNEIKRCIATAVAKQKAFLEKTYIQSNKLDRDTLGRYISGAISVLECEYIESTSEESHFEHLSLFFPDLSYEEYRETNRKILEYVLKKIRSQLIYDLRCEEKISRNMFR